MSKAIAVVEDDESIREMLRYYFQSVGYAVRAYESGEALFAGEEGLGLPALYILDIMLPGMDGLEILRRLREGRDTADVPVIMLTARSAEMHRAPGRPGTHLGGRGTGPRRPGGTQGRKAGGADLQGV